MTRDQLIVVLPIIAGQHGGLISTDRDAIRAAADMLEDDGAARLDQIRMYAELAESTVAHMVDADALRALIREVVALDAPINEHRGTAMALIPLKLYRRLKEAGS